MPRPGYYQIRLNPEIEAHIEKVCNRLGLDPDERGAKATAINYALRLVATTTTALLDAGQRGEDDGTAQD